MTARIIFSAVLLISASAAFARDISLEVRVGRASYRPGDSVTVGVRVVIPPKHYLYANPLGPGIGKPLNLFVDRTTGDGGEGMPWFEARRSAPARFNPPAGDWVWAYESEAFFFLRGVLTNNTEHYNTNAGIDRYEVIIDALICHTSCIPVRKSAAFELTVSANAGDMEASAGQRGSAFPAAPKWQARYANSEPSVFNAGRPAGGLLMFGANDETGGRPAPGLNLRGLSQAAGPSPAEPPSSTENYQSGSALAADSARGNTHDWSYAPLEAQREYGLLTAVLFALLAGLALNLTPCIFPLLSIRVLSFAQSAGEPRRRAVARSAAFAGGIVAVFLLLASLAAFAGLSWGQQFQNPYIMTGIIAMIFLFALGMFGFYTLAAPSSIGGAERKAGAALTGEFLKGAAATVMATPCAGPFLGALLAWALLQSPPVIFTLFAAMGAGMAAPYVLLSSSKRLMRLLPRPGRWVEDMKHAMGFLLLIFAVALMTSLDQRLTVTAVGICLSILAAASVNKRFAPFGSPSGRRLAVALISLSLLAAGALLSVKYLRADSPQISSEPESADGTVWREFTPQALAAAHEQGRSVIVNFTASWCTNCKLNRAAVLDAPEARRLYADKNITLLTADITAQNPPAQALLHHLGSRSIPFIAIFPADSPKNPVIMRDILSKERFLLALKDLP